MIAKWPKIIINNVKVGTRLLKLILSYLKMKTQRRYILEWLRSYKNGYLLNKPSPLFTFDAIRYLKLQVKREMQVFEYGSGGSTLFWLQLGAKCISIEHDPGWYTLIGQRVKHSPAMDYRLVPPELNQNKEQVNPVDPDDYVSLDDCQGYQFRKYVSQIDSFPDKYFDLVLIDGRARPSCIKHSAKKVKVQGMLVIDDAERPYYFEKTEQFLKDFEKKEFCGLGPRNKQIKKTNIYICLR